MSNPNSQIQQPHRHQEMQEGHAQPEVGSMETYKPRRLASGLIFGTAGAVGVGGLIWLFYASAQFAEIVNPINFITTGCFALFLIVVAIAQFGLYWSQRDWMSAQWNVMERGLKKTD